MTETHLTLYVELCHYEPKVFKGTWSIFQSLNLDIPDAVTS